jgi:hypothetical protein
MEAIGAERAAFTRRIEEARAKLQLEEAAGCLRFRDEEEQLSAELARLERGELPAPPAVAAVPPARPTPVAPIAAPPTQAPAPAPSLPTKAHEAPPSSDEPPDRLPRGKAAEKILAALAAGPLEWAELVEKTGIARGTLSASLNRLIHEHPCPVVAVGFRGSRTYRLRRKGERA